MASGARNAAEMIAEWEWIGDCDCCGYPSEIDEANDW